MNFGKKPSKHEVERINRLQRELFDRLYYLFEPPLPEGVPERLERIVASADINNGDSVLDVGTGTGILIPLIRKYKPAVIYACDISQAMLKQLRKNYPHVATIQADVRDLTLPDGCVDVVFINACYPNIADKQGAFSNLYRIIRPGGRMVISHPLGKAFIHSLKKKVPFPLDDFPGETEASRVMKSFGFHLVKFIDEPDLYIMVSQKGMKRRS